MKSLRILTLVLAGAILAGGLSAPVTAGISFEVMYSDLSPHGNWYVSANYGRVWQPSTYSNGWNPYNDGDWVYTDVGWTWQSDYAWGAVPYHYGTWALDPRFGWVWVPGYVWAPSWVVFRTGPDYIGWCPVRPGFSVGVNFSDNDYDDDFFVFVPTVYFGVGNVRTHVVPRQQRPVIIRNTTIVQNTIIVQNNIVINRGPDVTLVERATKRKFQPVPVEQVRNVMPGRVNSREDFKVEPDRQRKGLRASEQVPESTPLPTARNENRNDNTKPRDAQAAPPVAQRDRPAPAPQGDRTAPAPQRDRPAQVQPGGQPQQQPTAQQKPQPKPDARELRRQQIAQQKAAAKKQREEAARKKAEEAKKDKQPPPPPPA